MEFGSTCCAFITRLDNLANVHGDETEEGQLQMAFIKWALGPDWNAVVAVVDRRTPDSLNKLKVD